MPINSTIVPTRSDEPEGLQNDVKVELPISLRGFYFRLTLALFKWRSGNAYRFHVPKPEGDHWNELLEPLLKKDKMQCDAWNAEVQNLLIFVSPLGTVHIVSDTNSIPRPRRVSFPQC